MLSENEIINIAIVCHEANKQYCGTIGNDWTQEHWPNAQQWQRDSAIKGVEFRLNNPDSNPAAQHSAWLADKVDNGWAYGTEKNETLKTHPCIVPYSELPEYQRKKDALFQAIVDALK